jgi:hypothetical protein
MYDREFDSAWDDLSQEAAMFRAYALGVDAALGIEHPEELNALMQAHHRGLVQIAFDEGRTDAESALEDRTATGGGTGTEFEPGDREYAVWDRLVLDRAEDPSAVDAVEVPASRLDLPSALDLPDLLDRPKTEPELVRIPRFLRR